MDLRLPPERYPFLIKVIFVTFVIALPFVLGSSKQILDDGDVSWHLAAGAWIIEHRAIPSVDPFSHSMPGAPWVAHEWLSEILYAVAYQLAGYAGLAATVCISLVLLHLIVFRHLQARTGPVTLLVAFVALAIGLAPFTLARPHILVWPLLALWGSMLLRYREAGRVPPLPWALLMTFWANLHGSYPLGIVVAGAIALDAVIDAKWARPVVARWFLFGLASTVAALANANGIPGIIHPFTIMGMDSVRFIGEWRPSVPTITPFFFVILIGTLGGLFHRGVKFRLGELLLLMAMLALAFSQVRHQSWLAIVAVLLIAPKFADPSTVAMPLFGDSRERRNWVALNGALLAMLIAGRLALPMTPPRNSSNPWRLIASIPNDLRGQPVLNEYSYGGPLILSGIRPFIDGRADMYGDAFTTDYFAIAKGDEARFAKAVKQYGIVWTLFPPQSTLVKRLDRTPGWRRVYADPTGVIHRAQDASTTGKKPPTG
ncbi:MAG TPA: hypothetical protein VFK50_00585 [Sphingomicrobium sp.]|nr:hypothetical protein [Sphingomicrobium sp.]